MKRRDFLKPIPILSLAGCLRLEGTGGDNDQSGTRPTQTLGVTDSTTSEAVSETAKTTQREPTTKQETTTKEPTTKEPTEEQTKEQTTEENGETGLTLLKIQVDWGILQDELAAANSSRLYSGFSAVGLQAEVPQVTHLGIRLEDANSEQSFEKSTKWESGEAETTIEMIVSESETTHLSLAAVSKTRSETIGLASVQDITIQEGTTTRFQTGEMEWFGVEWSVLEGQLDEYNSGVFSADKEKEYFSLNYKATYPFHGEDLRYPDLLVALTGHGGPVEHQGNYHTYHIRADNPSPGSPSTSKHEFRPVIAAEKFGLPRQPYLFPPEGSFEISWE